LAKGGGSWGLSKEGDDYVELDSMGEGGHFDYIKKKTFLKGGMPTRKDHEKELRSQEGIGPILEGRFRRWLELGAFSSRKEAEDLSRTRESVPAQGQ